MTNKLTDHDRIVEMHTDMKHIKGKLDVHCKTIITHNNRITRIESWKDKVNGALGVTSILLAGVWAKLFKWV